MKSELPAKLSQISTKITQASAEFWLLLGLLSTFSLFYFMPTFFRYPESILSNAEYILPRDSRIGGDHYEIVNKMSRAFIAEEPRFVLRGPYPPFSVLFHMPFVFLDARTSYILFSLLILAVFIAVTLFLPGRIQPKKWHPAILMVFFTGLFSYGLRFEVERGQFNLFAVSCSLAAVWVFHRFPKRRWLAYLLFSLATQLKVYPFIFIINFVDDWQDWKTAAKRFAGLGLLNFAMLFMLGIDNFFRFFGDISTMATFEISVSVNHSIGSYVGLIVEKLPMLTKYSNYMINAMVLLVLSSLALAVYQAYKHNVSGINPVLILACATCAQLIPRISYDYTLSALPAVMVFFLVNIEKIKKSLISNLLILIICTAYGSTLYAPSYKYAAKELLPFLTPFSNNFPALLIMLAAAALLSFYFLPSEGK